MSIGARYRRSAASRLFDAVNAGLMVALMISMVLPFYYVLIASVSDQAAVLAGEVRLWPKGFTLRAYRLILADRWIWVGYRNTVLYVVGQTLATLTVTGMAAYALSKTRLLGGAIVLKVILITMLFDPGIVPHFIVVRMVGLYNNPLALIIPDAVNAYYLFIMRTFFMSIEKELEDAGRIDGCGHLQLFLRIVLPLSTAVVVTIALFVGVSQWNSFFKAMIYLSSRAYYPLQLYVREVVIRSSTTVVQELGLSGADGEAGVTILQNVRYAAIVASALPVIAVFPFVQKHFVQGAMLGSLKG